MSESHRFVTDDGYYIQLFRIVNPFVGRNTKPFPILFWHGLANNGDLWTVFNRGKLNSRGVYSDKNGTVVNNCGDTLTSNMAFTFAACGYDVWIGNNRGNKYSWGHIKLSRYCKFINFGLELIGDLAIKQGWLKSAILGGLTIMNFYFLVSNLGGVRTCRNFDISFILGLITLNYDNLFK